MILVMIIAGVALTNSTQALSSVSQKIYTARIWLHAIQLIVIGLVWFYWTAIVNWMASSEKLSQTGKDSLLQARSRIMIAILVFQIVVVMGIPFRNPFA